MPRLTFYRACGGGLGWFEGNLFPACGWEELRPIGRKEKRCCLWKWDGSAEEQPFLFFACVHLEMRQIPPKGQLSQATVSYFVFCSN